MRLLIDLQAAQAGNRERGIGRYALALTEALLRQAASHEAWIALNDAFPETVEPLRAAFDSLLPQDRIVVWRTPLPAAANNSANDWRRSAGEILRESFIAALDPDIVYLPSLFEGLVDNAVTSVGQITDGTRAAVAIHDLIPFMRPDLYLADPAIAAAYQRKITSLRRAGLWLPVSEWTRREAVARLDLRPEKAVLVANAADARFRPMVMTEDERGRIQARFGLSRPFVMYTGGADPRKNIEGLLAAWARLPEPTRAAQQLAIAGAFEPDSLAAIHRHAERLGLGPDELVLTGFVADDDLVALYNLCRVFCFPSLLEGFGLPVLEAMQCGAPAIGANRTGIPEVIGLADALFDPLDPGTIAARIQQVLTDESYRQRLAEHGRRQARNFSWQHSAAAAWQAFEQHQQDLALRSRRGSPPMRARRPRLAYVSPLPPDRSGIAEYSAELLPELAVHYDIDVIVSRPPVADSWINANCPVRDAAWFDRHGHRYDRVLYHFGNSAFHRHMFDLLRRHAGVVVLHDYYLSGVIADMDHNAGRTGFWPQSLYRSHGYLALEEFHRVEDDPGVIWKYPANLAVIQNALGVIVHNEYCRALGREHYGGEFVARWKVVPELRRNADAVPRDVARSALGFSAQDFVVCSFGVMGPIKLNHRLLEAWLASDLARDPRCHLVFAGEDPTSRYAARMRERMAGEDGASRVRITGFIAAELYDQYLAAADAAIQLRSLSRGETSRAVLDCMAHALPTIINAHGALAELPRDCLFVLAEEFTDSDLASAIAAIRADAHLATRLGRNARDYVRVHHSPRVAAARYRAAIEELSLYGRDAVRASAVAALGALEARPPGKPEWLAAARALFQDIPPANPARALFVDVSELARRDVGSGIQRVVRRVLGELIVRPPPGFRIEPVYATEESRGYFYARGFTARLLGCPGNCLRDAPLDCRQGDIFLGLDLQPHVVGRQGGTYDAMRRAGIGLYFVVHDLLPLSMPRLFAPGAAEVHARWLATITRVADGLICVSQSVADEVIAWLDAERVPRARPLRVGWVHHGADIRPEAEAAAARPRRTQVLPDSIAARPDFLMVGTIEPRKGHDQALSAFEVLWARGVDAGLVIVGRQGWMVEKVVRRLRTHPERGRRLVWIEDADDEALEALYARCTCLLAASEGEGFGLPLIEAARHGLPILARDLPVFREVAGRHARYFRAATAEDLAGAIEGWLGSLAAGAHERSDCMPWLAWAESSKRLMNLLLGDGWYASWPAAVPPAPPPAPPHDVEEELTGLNSEARS